MISKGISMMEVYERLGVQAELPADVRIILTHEQRERGRMRTYSTEGEEVRLFLARGTPLMVGEYLRTQCGRHVLIEGAIEPVVTASCEDWGIFSRACYHLGNRHVKVQIGQQSLRIQPDHVLEDMLQQLGLTLAHASHVFVPEAGAYGHAGHSHHRAALAPVTGTSAVDETGSIDSLDFISANEPH